MFNKFFFRLSIYALAGKIQGNKVVGWCQNGDFLGPVFFSEPRAAIEVNTYIYACSTCQTCILNSH